MSFNLNEQPVYTCVDGFSGAGGLCLGLKRAGMDILFSFDNDPLCIETHSSNPQYFTHQASAIDIKDLLEGALLNRLGIHKGELFLLAGGPPCQGFSIQRIGKDGDQRNGLVLKYVDLLEELFPLYFLVENVPGLMGRRGRTLFDEVIKRADEIGYYVHVKVLDAQDFGVPQRRRRVFIVGERKDLGPARFVFPEPTTPAGQRITVESAIGDLPATPEDGSEYPGIRHHRRDRLSYINRKRLMALQPGQGREHLPMDLLAACHHRSSAVIGHRSVYGRMSWTDVAPTITARFDSFTRGQFGHPEQIRSISLREGAVLQTFPLDFIFCGNKVDIARQIGNAVPPVLAEIVGYRIVSCHECKAKELITIEV